MPRIIGAVSILLLLAALCGCPVPIRDLPQALGTSSDPELAGTAPSGYGAVDNAQAATVPATGDTALPADTLPGENSGPPAGAPADAAATGNPETVPEQAATPAAGQPQVGPVQTPPADASGQAFNGPLPPSAAPNLAPVAPPATPAPAYGALDAENFMGDAPPDTAWGQPKPDLGEDALKFAGRWQVAVIHRAGEARMLEGAAEWLLELNRDGQFFAKQERGGQLWRQSGSWELSGMQLKLHSGPGGERTYEVSQELANICVLREPGKETALFCVRAQPDATAFKVEAKYDTDFGQLNLRPAGPGHWRGSYGAPAGELLLAQLGAFLVGTWNQAPSKGFVLLELRPGGFAGAWLYQSSTAFDGRWVGVAEH